MLRVKISDDRGSASLEFITAGLLLLVPLVYLIVAVGAIQSATLASEGIARQAARVFATAPTVAQGQARAQQALKFGLADFSVNSPDATLRVSCGVPSRCHAPQSVVTVTVTIPVRLPLVPDVLELPARTVVPVTAHAAEVVSRFHGGK